MSKTTNGVGSADESYNAPDHRPSTVRGSYMRGDSAGLSEGLSSISEFDSETSDRFPTYDNARNPKTGGVKGRPKPYSDDSHTVDSKGHKMTFC